MQVPSMDKIRTFIAIDLNEEIKKSISEFISQIRALSLDIKWVSVENIHLTVKFLGKIYASAHDKLYRGLEMAVENMNDFRLIVKGTGLFPDIRNPRVFWLGVEGDMDALRELVRDVEENLFKIGFKREERQFSPHITIGRFKSKRNADKLSKVVSDSSGLLFGEFVVSSLKVYRSDLTSAGPNYSLLKEIKSGKIE